MWRGFADLFRTGIRRQNVLKPDARLHSEECKQVGGSECNIFPVQKAVLKCNYRGRDDYRKEHYRGREETLQDCRPKWESSWIGALGWSGAVVLGWYASQAPCWRRFLHRRGPLQLDTGEARRCSLLGAVNRSLSPPAPVLSACQNTSLGSVSIEQAVDAAAERFAGTHNEMLGAVENSKGVKLMEAGEHKKAVAFFKRASAFQSARAAYNLGVCCEKGLGTSRNLEEAARWYQLASSRGHAGAMYNLGVFFAHGLGALAVDRARATQLFESAAELGQPDARQALDRIRRTAKARRTADDTKALYRALGVDVPAPDLRSLRISEDVLQGVSLAGRHPEVLELVSGGGRLFAPRRVARPGSCCQSEMSDRLSGTVYARYVRA
ncbi:uncharacterized protein LOC134541695 [Bacillus rossius redtenbacheri]|uniref:uncharacterized protein LOC134541695 n=1 Tax=Bacillus rossius redtenbacheri TaxID=93214 RepID=UPI002FDDE635